MTVKYGLLTAEDEWASEFEVYDFLYGLVRLLKPKVILETGTYKGGATRKMAWACQKNELGYVHSCDTDAEICKYADCEEGLVGRIGILNMKGIDLCQKVHGVDFAFIDSSGDRVAEVAALNLSPGAVVVLHDSNRPQYKPIWTLRPWQSIWHIPTIQGITVFVAP